MNDPRRVIKRYANRKLYDTLESRYVTLEQISEMIKRGEDIVVLDKVTNEDLTTVTLAQIVFEEEKQQRNFLPLAALKRVIETGGESIADLKSQISGSAERVSRVLDNLSPLAPLHRDVEILQARIDELEEKVNVLTRRLEATLSTKS